ncbi:hypothetical protein BJ508DRAFT_51070 [Ascobolus immersus RN42]|uniref:Uncharacterized protein n=1 Tax=Ascobolus immersus RN42 TaxID=1160509 RepID=A0A3N4IQD7_ASCIM|nr:hypothetical protein BJ508DRAFT_51070 [Ascobolus immersus RN42]
MPVSRDRSPYPESPSELMPRAESYVYDPSPPFQQPHDGALPEQFRSPYTPAHPNNTASQDSVPLSSAAPFIYIASPDITPSGHSAPVPLTYAPLNSHDEQNDYSPRPPTQPNTSQAYLSGNQYDETYASRRPEAGPSSEKPRTGYSNVYHAPNGRPDATPAPPGTLGPDSFPPLANSYPSRSTSQPSVRNRYYASYENHPGMGGDYGHFPASNAPHFAGYPDTARQVLSDRLAEVKRLVDVNMPVFDGIFEGLFRYIHPGHFIGRVEGLEVSTGKLKIGAFDDENCGDCCKHLLAMVESTKRFRARASKPVDFLLNSKWDVLTHDNTGAVIPEHQNTYEWVIEILEWVGDNSKIKEAIGKAREWGLIRESGRTREYSESFRNLAKHHRYGWSEPSSRKGRLETLMRCFSELEDIALKLPARIRVLQKLIPSTSGYLLQFPVALPKECLAHPELELDRTNHLEHPGMICGVRERCSSSICKDTRTFYGRAANQLLRSKYLRSLLDTQAQAQAPKHPEVLLKEIELHRESLVGYQTVARPHVLEFFRFLKKEIGQKALQRNVAAQYQDIQGSLVCILKGLQPFSESEDVLKIRDVVHFIIGNAHHDSSSYLADILQVICSNLSNITTSDAFRSFVDGTAWDAEEMQILEPNRAKGRRPRVDQMAIRNFVVSASPARIRELIDDMQWKATNLLQTVDRSILQCRKIFRFILVLLDAQNFRPQLLISFECPSEATPQNALVRYRPEASMPPSPLSDRAQFLRDRPDLPDRASVSPDEMGAISVDGSSSTEDRSMEEDISMDDSSRAVQRRTMGGALTPHVDIRRYFALIFSQNFATFVFFARTLSCRAGSGHE